MSKELIITTLIENMQDRNKKLLYEHGLSLYIEFDGMNIVFDTGQTGDYLINAEKLNKSISSTDIIIISHGHYDHAGGVIKTLPCLKKNTKMYVGEEIFKPKYKRLNTGDYKYNGIVFDENIVKENQVDLVKMCSDVMYLSDKVVLFKNFESSNSYEKMNEKFVVMENSLIAQDDFKDEIVLGMITSKGLVIVLGCSHVGVVNIMTSISKRINLPIYAVLGGTHLVEADMNRMIQTVAALKSFQIQFIAVSHCTGEIGIEILEKEFNSQFILNNTGNQFIM